MRSSELTNEISAALAKAQGEFPPIPKNKEVEVKNKEGTRTLYKFKYADLNQIIDSTRPALTKHGLSFMQSMTFYPDIGLSYFTRINHSSGQWIESGIIPIVLSEHAGMKDVAGASTYGKRLSLSSAVGVAADDDVDAPDGENESATAKDIKPKPKGNTSAVKPVITKTFEPDPKEKLVTDLLAKFRKLKVTEEMLRVHCDIPDGEPLHTYLTDIQIDSLKVIGSDIANKRKTVEQVFTQDF